MQSLGVVFGIFKDSYKIITSGNVSLYKIICFLILPTYFISLINKLASDALLPETGLNNQTNTTTTFNQTQESGLATFGPYIPYFHLFSSEFAPFWRLQLECFIPTLFFKLLYTSAGIYTAAYIHTGQDDVIFPKVMAVVCSKVWKRLFFTFFSTFIAFIAFTAVAMLVLAIASTTFLTVISSRASVITISIVVFFVMLTYLTGLVYLMLISQLANVVSVLEESGGFTAMKRSNQLLKGNMWVVAIIMFFFLAIVHCVVQYAYGKLVMYAWSLGTMSVIISSLLPIMFTLIELVSQTVLYFVCKSYHQEKVELDQVNNVWGGYGPLKTEELELEKFSHV